MKRNTELLEQTVQYIEDHPDRYDQREWICGTTACFAGHAALLAGWKYLHLDHSEAVSVKKRGATRTVYDAAIHELGITAEEADRLFGAYVQFPELKLMVKDLVNGDNLQAYMHYEREAGE